MSERVAAEIEIAAPPERVWEVVMDPLKLEDWVTIHRELGELGEQPLREGSSFEQKLSLAGKSFDVRWRVVRADEPRAADWEGQGPAGALARVAYRLEESGPGTQLRYENEFDFPAGFLGAVAGRLLVRSPARREAERSLQKLKGLLETR